MRAAPIRFFNAALWPLTIWLSLTHLDEHPADDYVERTSPIVATAIAFWAAVGLAVVTYLSAGTRVIEGDGEEAVRVVRVTPLWAGVTADVLWFFVPALYVIGLWLFTARDEAFPR
jgi:hypothetical protein